MLFNSFIFMLVFLPLVLMAFYGSRRWISARASLAVLVISSFIFYAYWEPIYLLLLLGSIVVNYSIGQRLAVAGPSKPLLIWGVALNLGLLAYFKYTNFLIDSTSYFLGFSMETTEIILPLAISFFTFQQVAYLVDCYRQIVRENDFLSYCLFVSFFPQLIAGPIVHHKEVMPQFVQMAGKHALRPEFAAGIALFIMGLSKKVLLADNFAVYVNSYYQSAGQAAVHAVDAWSAALAYHFQIYFDFSGYSDMALGLGLLFGVRLPVNFDSPVKSLSIIEFWRRWHITLSNFLRDYLYISLGGNRRGAARRYLNLVITMTLGGLWHGAAWNYVIWGALHGGYLLVNHGWRSICEKYGMSILTSNRLYKFLCFSLTTVAVAGALVYFRAPNIATANQTLLAMFGFGENGLSQGFGRVISENGFSALVRLMVEYDYSPAIFMTAVLSITFAFTLLLPNSLQLVGMLESDSKLRWRPNAAWALLLATMFASCLMGMFGITEFIYFQF